jgi:hypothetical protein
MEEYAEFVTELDPDQWGPFVEQGTIEWNGRYLVVTNRPSVHREIEAFMAEMRRTNTPVRQVKPEANQYERRKEGTRGGGLFGG